MIRAGAGIYYDFETSFFLADPDRIAALPRGAGRGVFGSAAIPNPSAGIPGVPQGAFLDLPNPSLFTGARLMESLAAIRADLARRRGDPNNRDFSVTNIEADKSSAGIILPESVPNTYSIHANLGLQRELARDLVLSADFAWRHFVRTNSTFDANRFFRRPLGPVIPACIGGQRNDPKALCSVGSINVGHKFGRAKYKGLLVRADKRLSKGWQVLGSYAYSSNIGIVELTNLDDFFENYGPLDRDVTHILNVSGIVRLPKAFQLGFGVTYNSRTALSPRLNNLDLNGDGTANDLLPGTVRRRLNRDLDTDELRRLVEDFNRTWAGRQDARGANIPTIRLPGSFGFDDSLFTQDVRVSRAFRFREHGKVTLIGEVFNLLNTSNLTDYGTNLRNPATFGQPAGRVTQVLGSGGPRAFQLAVRATF